jgi:hypothetical protein
MPGNFQVSSKLPDGRIFVVAGETFTDFCAALESAVGIEESQEVLKTMAQSITGAPTNAVQAVSNVRESFPNAQIDHTAHPTGGPNLGPTGRTCKHGQMSTRTGSGAKGPWKAYMCPSPKGTPDQCEPIWLRRNDPEWSSF